MRRADGAATRFLTEHSCGLHNRSASRADEPATSTDLSVSEGLAVLEIRNEELAGYLRRNPEPVRRLERIESRLRDLHANDDIDMEPEAFMAMLEGGRDRRPRQAYGLFAWTFDSTPRS